MAAASLVHTRCVYPPRLSSIFRNGPVGSNLASCSSSSSSSSSFPSSSQCSSSLGIGNNWKSQSLRTQAMSTSTRGNVASLGMDFNAKNEPDHLLVLVHGLRGSTSDWNYVKAELKRQLGRNFIIYASSCNMYTKTFDGIDEAGRRLADEVKREVQKTKTLKRISFLAHSLGGLFARYAIAVLYSPCPSDNHQTDDYADTLNANAGKSSTLCGTVAGLEPINFITLATPHLGVRGRWQLPFLLGVPFLEKLAVPMAPVFVGETGSQLFLTDGKPTKPPLLLRMASDCEDLKFISALGVFQCRNLYANVSYDHMVGWRTSSIRRETEPVKPRHEFLDGYKHVVDVNFCPPVPSMGPHFPPEAAKAKEAAQNAPGVENKFEYHEIMEEEMICGLQQLGWRKVDVSFHSALWPFLAHNHINVRNEWLHSAGVGVVAHVADSLKRQESSPSVSASS